MPSTASGTTPMSRKIGEQAHPHREPGHPAHRAQVAAGENSGSQRRRRYSLAKKMKATVTPPAITVLPKKLAERVIGRENTGQQRPDHAPDDAGERPPEEAQAGHEVRKEESPTPHHLGLRGRQRGQLLDAVEGSRPRAAEADQRADQQREDDKGDHHVRPADRGQRGAGVVHDAEIEERDDGAEEVAHGADPSQGELRRPGGRGHAAL